MQEPLDTQSDAQRSHWLNGVETFSVVASLGGAVASVVTQQVAFASIPLSLTATLNLINRRRLLDEMAQGQQVAIAQLVQQDQSQQAATSALAQQNHAQQQGIDQLVKQEQEHKSAIDALTQQGQEHQANFESVSGQFSDVDQQLQEIQQFTQDLAAKEESVADALQKLRKIDGLTQAIRANPRVADYFYQRGQVRQSLDRIEDHRVAIEDFTQAIKLESTHAGAHFNRGVLRSELGDKRQAVADLRIAAKTYFDQGDLDNYDQAKSLSEQLHELMSAKKPEASDQEAPDQEAPEQLAVDNLFE